MADTDKNVAQLQSEMENLKEDLADIKKVLLKMGNNGIDMARDRTQEEMEDLMEELERLKRQSRQAQRRVGETVEEHPLTTVLIAFGVGAMMGTIASAARR